MLESNVPLPTLTREQLEDWLDHPATQAYTAALEIHLDYTKLNFADGALENYDGTISEAAHYYKAVSDILLEISSDESILESAGIDIEEAEHEVSH